MLLQIGTLVDAGLFNYLWGTLLVALQLATYIIGRYAVAKQRLREHREEVRVRRRT